MGPGEVFGLLISIGIPALILFYILRRAFAIKEQKLRIEELKEMKRLKPDHGPREIELEQRLRVLEEIVTDRGAETAAQIEALRKPRALENKAAR